MLEPESLRVPDLTKFGMQRVAHMTLPDDGTATRPGSALASTNKLFGVFACSLASFSDRAPEAFGSGGHFDVTDAERGECIDQRVADRR